MDSYQALLPLTFPSRLFSEHVSRKCATVDTPKFQRNFSTGLTGEVRMQVLTKRTPLCRSNWLMVWAPRSELF